MGSKGLPLHAQDTYQTAYLDFYGDTLNIPVSFPLVNYNGELSTETISHFYEQIPSPRKYQRDNGEDVKRHLRCLKQ